MDTQQTTSNKVLFESYFAQAEKAYLVTIVLFVLSIFLYVVFQFNEGDTAKRCTKGQQIHEATPCDVKVSYRELVNVKNILAADSSNAVGSVGKSIGYFDIKFNDAVLYRFYETQKANEFKQHLTEKNKDLRELFIKKRIALVKQIEQVVTTVYPQERPIYIPTLDSPDLTFTVQRINLNVLADELAKLKPDFVTHAQANGNAGQKNNVAESYDYIVRQLKDLAAQEFEARKELIGSAEQDLQPQLSFLWLYHPGFNWILELVFWSWFGLFSCALVNLNKRCRENEYSAGEYCLLFPRIILAPVLGLVVVALISSGYAVQDQNLDNFPYLLMLFFFLGFASENVNLMIRDVANKIFRPVPAHEAEPEHEASQAKHKQNDEQRISAEDFERLKNELMEQGIGVANPKTQPEQGEIDVNAVDDKVGDVEVSEEDGKKETTEQETTEENADKAKS